MKIEEHIQAAGPLGSWDRLRAIALLCAGTLRGEAAQRALVRRSYRLELMEKGHTFEVACLIVNNENV